MSYETETKRGSCEVHGEVIAERQIPTLGFPFIVTGTRRALAKRRPFLCPECGRVVEVGSG